MQNRRFFDFRYVHQERRKANILACILFWSVLCYLLISRFVIMAMEVRGSSMAPTLRHGDLCIVDRFVYRFREPRRGEVVAFRVPGLNDLSVKRIVALPGETIRFDQHLHAHDVSEPYLSPWTLTAAGAMSNAEQVVQSGCYFVLGDNRTASLDSRVFGPVRRDWIVGRVVLNGIRPLQQPTCSSNRVVRSRGRPRERAFM